MMTPAKGMGMVKLRKGTGCSFLFCFSGTDGITIHQTVFHRSSWVLLFSKILHSNSGKDALNENRHRMLSQFYFRGANNGLKFGQTGLFSADSPYFRILTCILGCPGLLIDPFRSLLVTLFVIQSRKLFPTTLVKGAFFATYDFVANINMWIFWLKDSNILDTNLSQIQHKRWLKFCQVQWTANI